MDFEAKLLIEMFHDPVRLGHYMIYKILQQERDELFHKIMEEYEVSPMDRLELERMMLSPHYLQLRFPQNVEENDECVMKHAKRKRRMVS